MSNKTLLKESLRFVKQLTYLFLIYQLSRALFILLNDFSLSEMDINVLIGSILFDWAAISFINMPYAFFYFLPLKYKYTKGYQTYLNLLFLIINTPFIFTNIIDIEYFKFTGRRSSFKMILADGMENEIGGLIITFLTSYWYLLFIGIAIIFILWKIIPKGSIILNKAPHYNTGFFLKQFLVLILFGGILLVLGRGGIQQKPIKLVNVSAYGGTQFAPVVLNTPFCILKTAGKDYRLKQHNYFSENELNQIFNPQFIRHKTDSVKRVTTGDNVAIIILESFGKENIQCGQTPFLDSMIEKSLYFPNGYANGRVSMNAVPAIISGIPTLMNETFITSEYALNQTESLPEILRKNNYHTAFFHGAFNGSQNFEKYCENIHFNTYYGKDQYVGPQENLDGYWGIFDEEFLQFSAKEINTFSEPFFSTIFTISSHHPYTIPSKHHGRFPKGTTDIHESIAYADYALKRFFETAKKMPWYNNTLFIILADHTSSDPDKKIYQTNIGRFQIPILFYHPTNQAFQNKTNNNYIQQSDIHPTILDYLNINTKTISFGKSILSSDKDDFVIYFYNSSYHLILDDYCLIFDGEAIKGYFNIKDDPFLKKDLKDDPNTKTIALKTKHLTFLKAYIQSYNDRLNNNKLTIDDNNPEQL